MKYGDTARRWLTWTMVGLFLPATLVLAEDTLDEIVVSATRLETTVRDSARSVSLIEKEQIQNGMQQLGLDEALAGVPGLYMQNRYNFAQDLRISLRGFGARSSFGVRGVKVIVDGIPETLPDGQAQVDSIDLGSASRIEVLRGPASSLYGNASGGVIAVQTELGERSPFVEASLGAGELGYHSYGVKAGGMAGSADYLFNLSHQEIEGYRELSDARGSIFNGKLAIPLAGEQDRLTVAINFSDQPVSDDPGGVNAAQAAAAPRSARDANLQYQAGEALDQQRIGLVYEREREAGTLTLRNYYTWRTSCRFSMAALSSSTALSMASGRSFALTGCRTAGSWSSVPMRTARTTTAGASIMTMAAMAIGCSSNARKFPETPCTHRHSTRWTNAGP